MHKEGPKNYPDSYRGICIMNALLKLTCTIMYKRLEKYVNENNVVNAEQIGIKRRGRTSDHILTIKTLVNKYVGDQKGKK